MPVKFIPAAITIEVPTDAVTLDAETVSALLDGSADRTILTRVRNLLAPTSVTITEGTRVRLQACPAEHPDFEFGMQGWGNDDVTVDYVTDVEVRIRSKLAQDYTIYTGPLEKILDVLEVLEDKSPVPAELAAGWIAWDFSNDEGPHLPKDALVEVKLREDAPIQVRPVRAWNWRDGDTPSDIVAYRIV